MPSSQHSTSTDFPCCTFDLYPACCHHYPGGIVGCTSRSLLQRQRPSSLLWRVGFHNDISGPAQCSLALRPAESVDLLRDLFKKCFSPFVTSWPAPCTSGRSASWPGWIRTNLSNVPSQGTHNNAAERSLRTIAVGRKNWLFAGSTRGGEAAAIVLSFVESTKLHHLNPYAYLRDLLTRLPAAKSHDLDSLLPHHWQPP